MTVDGPSKVTLDAYEVDLGYKVRYTPLAPGDYFMTVRPFFTVEMVFSLNEFN